LRRDSARTIAVVVAAVVVAGAETSAHRLDELLQAARLGIADDRVDLELDLTPGAAVADRMIAEIDRDGDGSFSDLEQRAFVDRVFAEIEMTADGRAVRSGLRTFTLPAPAALRTGDGIITIRASAPLTANSQGGHHLAFTNGYRRDISVYLANALVPETDRVAVTGQERDGIQSRLTIAYAVRAQRKAALPYAGLTAAIAAIAVAARKSLFG
jgi:hypothetical protein